MRGSSLLSTRIAVTAALVFLATPDAGAAQDGPVVCWGGSSTTVCADQLGNFEQVSAGGHSVGLRSDGTIECWGASAGPGGACNVPPGTFKQVVAGGKHTVALRTDGTIACWGNNQWGQCDAPSGTFIRVEAGFEHSMAIRADNTVACWGRNSWGQCDAPAGAFVDIAAGTYNSVGIRSNGTLACWGDNSQNQCQVPVGVFKQVTMGEWGGVALRMDGTLACWGWHPYYGQCEETPSGTFTQVSAYFNHIVALRPGGTAVCWGVPGSDPCAGKPCERFSQISAGGNHTLGLLATASTEEEDIKDQCSLYLSKWGDLLVDWPAQQGIAHDGQHFYTSGGTCVGPDGISPMRLIKWDPIGSDGWTVLEQSKEVDKDLPKPTCHIGGIDVANGRVYAVLSDFGLSGPVTTGYLRCFNALDLTPEWHLDLSHYIGSYDFEDFAGVAVGPEGDLYVVTYQSDDPTGPSKSTYVFKVNLSGGAPDAVYPLKTNKANGIDIVDGVLYVSVDLSPGWPDPEPRGAIEVYEELCETDPGEPVERRYFDIPPGAFLAKHAEGLAVVSDDAIWTAQWTHAVKLGTGGQPDPFCHGPSGLAGDTHTLSLAAGGTQTLELGAGSGRGGEAYLVLGSMTGTSPGIPYGPDSFPLNPDAYLAHTLNHANSPPLDQSFGVLDHGGGAVTTLTLPAGFAPELAGTVLHHAAIVFDLMAGPAVSFVSSPVPLALVP